MSRLLRLCLLVGSALLLSRLATCRDHCDPQAGPPGQTKCFYDNAAGRLTWFACVSNSYITALTKGKNQCDMGFPYCLYGCLDEGVLTGNCDCGEATDYMPADPTVPAWCYDPLGTGDQQCSWYRDCLNAKHMCEDSSNGYALAYGERFCNLYTENVENSRFTERAVQWIDAVRRCLQVALVPLLRPWHSPTCGQIRDTAFASHTDCYLSPAVDAPGICDLPFQDWLAVFWTIKGSLVTAPLRTLKGMVETARGCVWKLKQQLSRLLQLGILRYRSKRLTVGVDVDAIFGEIVGEIVQRLGWDNSTLDWFGYTPDGATDTEDDESLEIYILLGDKAALGLTDGSNAPSVNLDDTVMELMNAVIGGTLEELQLSTGNATIWSVTECDTLSCGQAGPCVEI